jgi:hypothetical protein
MPQSSGCGIGVLVPSIGGDLALPIPDGLRLRRRLRPGHLVASVNPAYAARGSPQESAADRGEVRGCDPRHPEVDLDFEPLKGLEDGAADRRVAPTCTVEQHPARYRARDGRENDGAALGFPVEEGPEDRQNSASCASSSATWTRSIQTTADRPPRATSSSLRRSTTVRTPASHASCQPAAVTNRGSADRMKAPGRLLPPVRVGNPPRSLALRKPSHGTSRVAITYPTAPGSSAGVHVPIRATALAPCDPAAGGARRCQPLTAPAARP